MKLNIIIILRLTYAVYILKYHKKVRYLSLKLSKLRCFCLYEQILRDLYIQSDNLSLLKTENEAKIKFY